MNDPWICPRCGIVNAPWVPHCSCRPKEEEEIAQEIKPGACQFCCGTGKIYDYPVSSAFRNCPNCTPAGTSPPHFNMDLIGSQTLSGKATKGQTKR